MHENVVHAAPFSINTSIIAHDDPASKGGAGEDEFSQHAVHEAPAQRSIGAKEVLREFSTEPLPEMAPRRDVDGRVETELIFPPSGRAGAVSLYTSQHVAAAGEGEQSQYGGNVPIDIPMESFVNELLVPAGWTDPGTARVAVYGRRGAVERVSECRAIDLLPQRETITYLGALETSPPIPGAPRHAQAVRHMLDRLGWVNTTFDVYRCSVHYPVLHTMVRIAVNAARG